jgi:hypothetical protein
MGLAKQAKTLSKGQGDSEADLVDDERLRGTDRLGDLPARLCK